MSRSNFNNSLANQLEGVIVAPKKEEKWTWTGVKVPVKPTARTTSSTLARAIVCGTKDTGHPEGLVDAQEMACLLMMDIMDGLK